MAVGLSILSVAGCERPPGERDAVVLSVGEREFTRADFDRFTDGQFLLAGSPDAPLLSALFDEFARERLLLIAADEAGIGISAAELDEEIRTLGQRSGREGAGEPGARETAPEDIEAAARYREQVRDRLRVRRFLETVVLRDLEVSDEAIRFEYETSRALYARPETVTLSEQRYASREAADAAISSGEVAAGNFFGIGAFRRGELPDLVDEAVFGLEAGETTGVIETTAGYRVFRVDERLPAAALDLEEVEEVVRMTVLRREADTLMEAFVADLERRHSVQVHAERLEFPYVGLLTEAE